MRRAVSVGGVSAAAVRTVYRALLGAGCFAVVMAPGIVAAQQSFEPDRGFGRGHPSRDPRHRHHAAAAPSPGGAAGGLGRYARGNRRDAR